MTDPQAVLDRSRHALHAVAELVLAGPQYRRSGKIRLRVTPDGFSTVTEPRVAVVGTEVHAGGRVHPIAGNTCAALAAAIGAEASGLQDVYREGSGATADEPLALEPDAARQIEHAHAIGDAALRRLAPKEEPVLWPEHFDVGIRLDDVNYGVSPGDGFLGEPYAYVGVDPVPADPYWNAPFGRALPMTAFRGAETLYDFFIEARTQVTAGR